jgi:hypothetical protein
VSFFRSLDGAELVVADEEMGIFFVWHGGAQVHVIDERGHERDVFSISKGFERKLTLREVRAVIEAHLREMREDDA